jgi:hypothetical protein
MNTITRFHVDCVIEIQFLNPDDKTGDGIRRKRIEANKIVVADSAEEIRSWITQQLDANFPVRFNTVMLKDQIVQLPSIVAEQKVSWTHTGKSSMRLREGFFMSYDKEQNLATVRLKNGKRIEVAANLLRHLGEESDLARFVEQTIMRARTQ